MPATRSANEIFEELKNTKKKVTIDDVVYYIIEGDLRLDEDQLLTYAFELAEREKPAAVSGEQREPLVGITDGAGRIVRWKKGLVLTYAVLRNTFSSDAEYQTVVQTMRAAAADWEATCGVNFRRLDQIDGGASGGETPLFVVKRVDTGGQFIALAFFPNEPLERRVIVIDPSFFSPNMGYDRTGVLRHELGHVLGFRHEHIRSGAPALCKDESLQNTINLSDYDPRSVMHYFCGGVGTRDMKITEIDREASIKLYGPPDKAVHYYE